MGWVADRQVRAIRLTSGGTLSVISKYNTRNSKDLHAQRLKLEHTKKIGCPQVQKLGIVSHNPLEIPNPLYDSNKSLNITF